MSQEKANELARRVAEKAAEMARIHSEHTRRGQLPVCRCTLRIVAGTTLMDMAERLDKTPAELSAVEMGRKPATPELASATAKFFADKGIHGTQAVLMVAVEASKGEKGC